MSGGDHGVSSEDKLFQATHIMSVFYHFILWRMQMYIFYVDCYSSAYALDIDTVMKAGSKF